MNLRSTRLAWEVLVKIAKHNRQNQIVTIERALVHFAEHIGVDISDCKKGY